jgi:hypothetical protein
MESASFSVSLDSLFSWYWRHNAEQLGACLVVPFMAAASLACTWLQRSITARFHPDGSEPYAFLTTLRFSSRLPERTHPSLLVSLRGVWGWSLFAVVWGCAVLGVLFKLRFLDRHDGASTAFYIAMGWIVVVAITPLAAHISFGALV